MKKINVAHPRAQASAPVGFLLRGAKPPVQNAPRVAAIFDGLAGQSALRGNAAGAYWSRKRARIYACLFEIVQRVDRPLVNQRVVCLEP